MKLLNGNEKVVSQGQKGRLVRSFPDSPIFNNFTTSRNMFKIL